MLIISSATPKSSLYKDKNEYEVKAPIIVCNTMSGQCEQFTGEQVWFLSHASASLLNWNRLSMSGVCSPSLAYDVPKEFKYWVSDDNFFKKMDWRAKINRLALAGVEPWGKYTPEQRSRADDLYDYAWVLTDTCGVSSTLGVRFTTPVVLGNIGEQEFVQQFSENGYFCEYGSYTYMLGMSSEGLYTTSLVFGTDRVSHIWFERALAMLMLGYRRGEIKETARGIVCYSSYCCFVVEDAGFKRNSEDYVNIVCYTATRVFYIARHIRVSFLRNEAFNMTSYSFDCSVPSTDTKYTIGEFMLYLLVNGALNKRLKSCGETDVAFEETRRDISCVFVGGN